MSPVSVLLTAYNEAESLPHVCTGLYPVLPAGSEIIIVDDCSTDDSPAVIASLAAAAPFTVVPLRMERNTRRYGALAAAREAAKHDVLLIIDADLQDDPADIPALLNALTPEVGAVIGWRKVRQHSLHKTVSSATINTLANLIFPSKFHDTNASLKALRASALAGLPMTPIVMRYLPHILSRRGIQVVELPVQHRNRQYGQSHFGLLNRMITVWHLVRARLGFYGRTSTETYSPLAR